MDTITIDGQEITPEEIQTEFRNGKTYITTAPLPEYIWVDEETWEDAESYDSGAFSSYQWVEALGHADEDVDNDGHVLHLDAANVTASYRLLTETEDGNRILHLVAWAEL